MQTASLVHENKNSLIYRSGHTIIKSLRPEMATPNEVRKLEREYEILKQFDSPYIIKTTGFSLKDCELYLEDVHGHPLSEEIKKNLSLEARLKLACQIAKGLEAIHFAQVIHKDLSPENILVYEGGIKFIDFGLSSRVSRENHEITKIDYIEGSLPYISPEQTGRINRPLDYRSDIYSLGIVLYELMTGELPFKDENPVELIHSHLAKEAKPPHEVNPDCPLTLSEIIMKCLAKIPSERYKSAFGLRIDLEKMVQDPHKAFPIGEMDVLDHFELPTKIYGREEEKKILLSSYTQVKDGRVECLFIEGSGGIGKTSLVKEIELSTRMSDGFFISGSFDQFKKQIPYHALIDAIQNLIEQVMTHDDKVIENIKLKAAKAVGDSGQVLIDIVPESRLILGEVPPMPRLTPEETQNRFNYILTNFLESFIDKDTPLVMLLENMQWADDNSIRFIEDFLTKPSLTHFLLITTHRGDELTSIHRFNEMVVYLRHHSFSITDIHLKPLPAEVFGDYLQETYRMSETNGKRLANLIITKSGGNPFFAWRFLKLLYEKGLFNFDPETGSWSANVEDIKKLTVADNVAALLSHKMTELKPETQSLLKIGSTIGPSFNLSMCSKIAGIPFQEAERYLNEAITEELIFKEKHQTFTFQHDRIQEAAHKLLLENEVKDLHYKIAKELLKDNKPENIFAIADHFNEVLDLIKDHQEKIVVSKANYLAGLKAASTAAYSRALSYFQNADQLIANINVDYDYYFEVRLNLSTAERVAGSKDTSDKIFKELIQKSNNTLLRGRVYAQKSMLYLQENLTQEALQINLEGLREMGYNLPSEVTRKKTVIEIIKTELLAFITPKSRLEKVVKNSPPSLEVTMILFSNLVFTSYILGYGFLCLFYILKMYQITLRKGTTVYGLHAMALYGAANSWIRMRKYTKGYELGELANRLIKNYPNSPIAPHVQFQVYTYTKRWGNSLEECIPPLKSVYRRELELGNFPFAYSSLIIALEDTLLSNHTLEEVLEDVEYIKQDLRKISKEYYYVLILIRNFCLIQLGKEKNLITKEITEDLERSEAFSLYHFFYLGLGVWDLYLKGDYERAKNIAIKLLKHNAIYGNNPFWNQVYLMATLSFIASSDREKLKNEIDNNIKWYSEWAKASPNYRAGYHLLLAEKAKTLGQFEEAFSEYHIALETANLHESALIHERIAFLNLALNRYEKAAQIAKLSITEYSRWGSLLKSTQIKNEFSTYLKIGATSLTRSTTTLLDTFDINSLIDASQAISKEIVLPKLMDTMMHIVSVNAGASRAVFLLENQNKYTIEAEAPLTGENYPQKIDDKKFSLPMINYVIRTQKTLVLNNAAKEGPFTNDSYVKNHHALSIAIIPLIQQSKMTGLIYLENNLSEGAFNKKRLEFIELLTSQMAISIENAKFYSLLERKVEERTFELQKAQEQLIIQEKLKEREMVKNKLGRFVPNMQVLNQFIEKGVELKGEERFVTILVCDIRGFTTLSEKLSPKETVEILNQFFTRMVTIIRDHKGILDKFIGDAFMSIFGALEDDPNHAQEAIDAAIDIQKEIKAHLEEKGIMAGIGIHTGKVLMGNIGSEERMEYTAIGDTVNTAFRIESLTRTLNTDILISSITKSLLHNNYPLTDEGEHPLKGKSDQVRVYKVDWENK